MFLIVILVQILMCNAHTCVLNRTKAVCRHQELTRVPQDLPRIIIFLDISYNNLTVINSSELSEYKSLQTLLMNDNILEFLHFDAFCGLSLLIELSLARNNLHVDRDYPNGLFKPLINLSELDISQNMKKNTNDSTKYTIPVNELKHLNKLTIDLVHQPHFGEHFRKMRELEVLIFDFCFVELLTNKTFMNMPNNVSELFLNTCRHFVVIETNALFYFNNLNTLDFSGSNIHLSRALNALYPFQNRKIDNVLFRGITYQELGQDVDIVLTNDMIKYIKSMCVQTLDLSNNLIVKIVNESLLSLDHPECLQNLLLSANRFSLDNFATDFFKFLHRAKQLKLVDYSYIPIAYNEPLFLDINGNNYRKVLGVDRYYGSKIIPFVRLPSHLEYVRFSHIMAATGMKEIVLANSSLRHLDISNFKTYVFPKFTFEGTNNLTYLDISGISAETTIGKFPVLQHLESLVMKNAQLYKLLWNNTNIFKWAPNLQSLDLSYNYIWRIQDATLGNLPYLRNLNLSHNMFNVIPKVLMTFKFLAYLDLSINQLTNIPKYIRDWVDLQQEKRQFNFFLNKNPYICSCDTIDFLFWTSKTKVKLDRNGNYLCWIPIKNGKSRYMHNILKFFRDYFGECKAKMWLQIGTGLLSFTICALLISTLVYNFRWRIIFFFYRTFRRFVERRLDVMFKYDVYVSYSDDCEAFLKLLSGVIEEDWGFKMCCQDRDFTVGAPSADERVKHIHCSRDIIFLVTPSFNDNEWIHFEIERAKYEKITKYLQKIVVITKGISLADIQSEFATIWQEVLFIEWPTEEEEKAKAWQKLKLWLF